MLRKSKKNYSLTKELIITILNNKGNKEKNIKSSNKYFFSHPLTGKIINISEICSDEKIIIQEDVITLLEVLDDKKKEEFIVYLAKQGVDIFNISDKFYNDLCFHYESPNKRDVPLRDRIAAFFPNITLCEQGCESKGVDLEKMKAKCECTFNNLMNNNLMDNFYGRTISEFMSVLNSFNIGVVQCFKDIFNKEQFVKCIGGFLILTIISGQLVCMFKFIFDGLYIMRKYIFSLSESFNLYMKKFPSINAPLKKKRKKTMKVPLKNENNIVYSTSNIINSNNSSKYLGKRLNKLNGNISIGDKKLMRKKTNKLIDKQLIDEHYLDNGNEYMNKIKEFLSPSFDETDFDDVVSKDTRKFCQYFCKKFQNNQIFINAFCVHEIFRPRALKLLLLAMTIELYFVINALFYNEEYLSELFNSKEKDSFFSFIPRRLNQYIYTSAVSGIISYLMGYFFIDEVKLRRIFIRNKSDEMKLKYELSVLISNIDKRFFGLIIFSLSLSIICFIYISCFNIVYPYIREEWIKSSLFILILMQTLNFLITLIETCIRYSSINCNSQKMFRLSLWFS